MTDRLLFPDGSQYTFVSSPGDPNREPLVMEFLLQPHCLPPPPHVHPGARETFEVLDGAFELQGRGTWHRLEAGQSLTVEPGEVHTFRNHESAPVRVRNVHDPAHGFEPYLRGIDALMRKHRFTKVTPRRRSTWPRSKASTPTRFVPLLLCAYRRSSWQPSAAS